MASGIYQITCKITALAYVGQSKNISNRWKRHHKRFNQALFDYEILEICSEAKLNERERYHVKDKNCVEPFGFNKTRGGDTWFVNWNDRICQNISDKVKLHYADSPDARLKRSEMMKKRFEDDNERQNMREACKRFYEDNPEARLKISEATKKAFRDNPESLKKIAEATKKRFEDPEAREAHSVSQKKRYEDVNEHKKLSEAQTKRFEDPMAREKHSKAGKQFYQNNPEARLKQSEAIKAGIAKKKAERNLLQDIKTQAEVLDTKK